MWIKNDSQKGEELVNNITNTLNRFELNELSGRYGVTCINVPAEAKCTSTYTSGRNFVPKLKQHVLNAGRYVCQISVALEQADQASVRSTSR